MAIARTFFFISGVTLLGAAVHASISMSTHYGSPQSVVYLAVALGIGAGAIGVGHAVASKRRVLAAAIMVALVAGECFALLTTAERIVAGREAKQAPLREAARMREQLAQRLSDTQTDKRVSKAEEALRRVHTTIADKSALSGCASNCRKLLQVQLADAKEEVASSRVAANAKRIDIKRQIESLPPLRSPSPLADRLSIDAVWLDIIIAALASLSANFLGCCLIALGAHTKTQRSPATIASIHQWATASIADKRGSLISLNEAFEDYRRWAISNHAAPASHAEFDLTFGAFIKLAGCNVRKDGDNWLIAGKAISS